MVQTLDCLGQTLGNVGAELNLDKVQVFAAEGVPDLEPLRLDVVSEMTMLGRKLELPGDDSHQGLALSSSQVSLGKEIERMNRSAQGWVF